MSSKSLKKCLAKHSLTSFVSNDYMKDLQNLFRGEITIIKDKPYALILSVTHQDGCMYFLEYQKVPQENPDCPYRYELAYVSDPHIKKKRQKIEHYKQKSTTYPVRLVYDVLEGKSDGMTKTQKLVYSWFQKYLIKRHLSEPNVAVVAFLIECQGNSAKRRLVLTLENNSTVDVGLRHFLSFVKENYNLQDFKKTSLCHEED